MHLIFHSNILFTSISSNWWWKKGVFSDHSSIVLMNEKWFRQKNHPKGLYSSSKIQTLASFYAELIMNGLVSNCIAYWFTILFLFLFFRDEITISSIN